MFLALLLSLPLLVSALPIPSSSSSRATIFICVAILIITFLSLTILLVLKCLFIKTRKASQETLYYYSTDAVSDDKTNGFLVGCLGSSAWETRICTIDQSSLKQTSFMYNLHTESRRYQKSLASETGSTAIQSINNLPSFPEKALLDCSSSRRFSLPDTVTPKKKWLDDVPRRPTNVPINHASPSSDQESSKSIDEHSNAPITFKDILSSTSPLLPPVPVDYFLSQAAISSPPLPKISHPYSLGTPTPKSRSSSEYTSSRKSSSSEVTAKRTSSEGSARRASFSLEFTTRKSSSSVERQVSSSRRLSAGAVLVDSLDVQFATPKLSPPLASLPAVPSVASVVVKSPKIQPKAHVARSRRISPSIGPSPLREVTYHESHSEEKENTDKPEKRRATRTACHGRSSGSGSDSDFLHMIQELVEETNEWDESLVLNPGFKAMLQHESVGHSLVADPPVAGPVVAQALPTIPSETDVTYTSRVKHPSILLADDGFSLTVDQRETVGVAW